jgi:hypothetical protein
MPAEEIQRTEPPTAAFILSLLGGLWMLASGGMMGGFGWGGMMGGWQGMHGWMWGRSGIRGFGLWWPWYGMVAGIAVLVGAIMLYVKREQRRRWGMVILLASASYLVFGMMGLAAGTLGVIGGVLALTTKD